MVIQKNIKLNDSSTFGLFAKCSYHIEFNESTDLLDISDFVASLGLPTLALGGGSNIIFCIDYPGVIIKNTAQVIEQITPTKIKVDAGCLLDTFVEWATLNNLSGIEALSGIPGTVGGAVALCAGAYGSTIKDTLHSVRVYDIATRSLKILETGDLHYWHRSSIFREKRGSDLIVLDATFKLHRKLVTPAHPKLPLTIASPAELRNTVLALRQHMPDPFVQRNCGSFFLNPTVPNAIAKHLQTRYPGISMRKYDTGHQQLAAGWLLDTAGLRGNTVGPFYFHKEHANIVINTGSSSTGKDVVEFINTVQQQIFSMFGIHIVAEPLLVGEEYWQGTIGEPTIKNLVHTY